MAGSPERQQHIRLCHRLGTCSHWPCLQGSGGAGVERGTRSGVGGAGRGSVLQGQWADTRQNGFSGARQDNGAELWRIQGSAGWVGPWRVDAGPLREGD